MKKIILTLIFCVVALLSKAQEEKSISFETGFDIYSRYVWRGLLFSDAPNIQPYMSLSWKNFTIMGWGSYSTSKSYAESDLFLSWSADWLTINLNDYYSEDEEDLSSVDYFDWKRSSTGHLIEAGIVIDGTEKNIPLLFTASTLIYGADLDSDNNQNYSSYFELKHPFTINEHELAVYAGGTINSGYYSDDAAIVNIGVESTYKIKINEDFSIPFITSFIVNPDNGDLFIVLGISF